MIFTKIEGCGNHFILIDTLKEKIEPRQFTPEMIRSLCTLHTGVGADGILWIGTPQHHHPQLSPRVPRYEMVVDNADGSRAEMCGNGLRCVVWYLHQNYQFCSDPSDVESILTGAGPLNVSVNQNGLISVEMGWPQDHQQLKTEMESKLATFDSSSPNVDPLSWGYYSLGNPHLVTFENRDFSQRHLLGPILEKLPHQGVNVSFAQIIDSKSLVLKVFERGCGWTFGCGTGACATVYHGYQKEFFSLGTTVEVKLPGGFLHIQLTHQGLVMWGQARIIYQAQLLDLEMI